MKTTTDPQYNYEVVKYFTVSACIYLVLGTAVGVWIASELAWPFLNFDIPYITFGRLRPVHTNIVVYGFGGSVLMATAYYVIQRTCGVGYGVMPWHGSLFGDGTST